MRCKMRFLSTLFIIIIKSAPKGILPFNALPHRCFEFRVAKFE